MPGFLAAPNRAGSSEQRRPEQVNEPYRNPRRQSWSNAARLGPVGPDRDAVRTSDGRAAAATWRILHVVAQEGSVPVGYGCGGLSALAGTMEVMTALILGHS